MASAYFRTTIFGLCLIAATAAMAEPPPATSDPVDGLVSSPDNFKLRPIALPGTLTEL